jgi:hypothetical protein
MSDAKIRKRRYERVVAGATRRQAEVYAPLPAAHAAAHYARHAPDRTLLYALVEAHSPDFIGRVSPRRPPSLSKAQSKDRG